MLSGKAIARALRGHFLIESALTTKLLAKFFPFQLEQLSSTAKQSRRYGVGKPDRMKEDSQRDLFELDLDKEIEPIRSYVDPTYEPYCHQLSSEEIKELSKQYTSFVLPDHATQSESFQSLQKCIAKYKCILSQSSRTAKLWLQYLSQIQVLKLYICAARTGN